MHKIVNSPECNQRIIGGNLTMLNDTVMSGSLYYIVFNVFNPFV